ncbi:PHOSPHATIDYLINOSITOL N-ACETYLGLUCOSAMINYLTRANSFERASE SUBUNIT P DOWN SYNDROME CRITICAL REGION PROTEIN 5 -RELATED [Salix purpurea]|uniref:PHOSPHATIDYLINOSITOL N-ACETYLGLUCOSAMINYLTRANSFERASE SUBUNIT P DOWN SYNDROME CRITICAL REGION PROTEIN 5 -RELATED n=1 Tax=Salix purpurea TaxID=77065 RepID=A0A9Q0Z9R2_SALPP|nr:PHOSPHATIDYLINOSITOL N-ACETYLGLUCOSAMINYLTRANSFERASE SUBUNIT P DOWN SYNDROME CRITICAL REGION PROTEIN 5 -RELATED [Salix purpurea]
MGIEKEVSKSGGGYVGGFFQLFDWTAKSRKKLFSSKSDLPERSKQGKRSDGSLPMTRLHLMDDDENGAGSGIRGGSDYSCASSVTDDDGYGARAPGVVARLMGLDSMPTSNLSEPNSTPFFDTQSLRDASRGRRNFDYYQDHQIAYSGNLPDKQDGPPRNFEECKPQKVLSRPIEKFQTEILPPKSAKSIPITHHKLLSPMKSPGFIPNKTAAHIMEAAAKIIEPGSQAAAKPKMPAVGSSSVPLKVRDLKEKLEVAQKMPLGGSSSAALRTREPKEKVEVSHKTLRLAETSRRPVESNAAKHLKGQSLNKSWNGSDDTSYRTFSETDEGSSSSKTKGKSISLAIQAKVNVQRREGMNLSSSQGFVGQKEQREISASQSFKCQPNVQKSSQKRSPIHNTSGVLRQNNQKQNCIMDKDKLPSKPLVSNLPGKRVLSGNPPVRHKTSSKPFGSKNGSRKLDLDLREGEKGNSNYSTANNPRKKRSIDGNLHVEKNQVVDNKLIDRNQKAVEPNLVIDRHFSWTEESKRKGMDVVSFTFTAPLTRSMPGSETPTQAMQKNSGAYMDNRSKRLLLDTDSMKLSSVGYNVIGGDALSSLLEQKLRELTKGVESSSSISTFSSGGTAPRLHDNKDQSASCTDKSDSCYDSPSPLFSTDPAALRLKHIFQGVDEMDCSSKSNDARQLLDCRRPSPVSVLEHSFSTESSNSLDSMDSCSTEGSKHCSSIQTQGVLGLSSTKRVHFVDADMDLSDSGSSTSTGTVARKHANMLAVTGLVRSKKWEVQYVKKILCNLELKFQDSALGRASEIINPHLFHQLERKKNMLESDGGDEARLERKVLFDCASECLDLRCRRYVGGGYKAWVKGTTMVRRKEWLAEDIYKEISEWNMMGDCMVDELVDKDMSSQYGRWLDFEVDAYSLGVEFERQIFNSLVNEVVADILRF